MDSGRGLFAPVGHVLVLKTFDRLWPPTGPPFPYLLVLGTVYTGQSFGSLAGLCRHGDSLHAGKQKPCWVRDLGPSLGAGCWAPFCLLATWIALRRCGPCFAGWGHCGSDGRGPIGRCLFMSGVMAILGSLQQLAPFPVVTRIRMPIGKRASMLLCSVVLVRFGFHNMRRMVLVACPVCWSVRQRSSKNVGKRRVGYCSSCCPS